MTNNVGLTFNTVGDTIPQFTLSIEQCKLELGDTQYPYIV